MALHDIYSGRELGLSPASSSPGAAPSRDHADVDRLALEHDAGDHGVRSAVARRSVLPMLLSLLLCGGAGAASLALAPPRYLATATLLIEPQERRAAQGEAAASDPMTNEGRFGAITARPVLTRAADRAGLRDDPEFNGSDRSLTQRLLHPRPVVEGGVDLQALQDAVAITRSDRSGVAEVAVTARAAAAAAAIANAVATAYLDEARAPAPQEDAARDDLARAARVAVDARIKSLDARIAEARTKNGVIEASGLRAGEQQVTDLTRALGEARTKAAAAKAKLDEATALARSGRIDEASATLMSPAMGTLRRDQAEAEQETARLAQTLGDRHPDMREASERQASARARVAAELGRLRTALAGEHRAAQAAVVRLEASLAQAKEQAGQISRSLQPLGPLETERAGLRLELDHAAQAAVGSHQDVVMPPGRLIAEARPPASPSSPKPLLVGLASLSAGLILGLLGMLVNERAARSPPATPRPVGDGAPGDGDRRKRQRRPPTRRYWTDDEA